MHRRDISVKIAERTKVIAVEYDNLSEFADITSFRTERERKIFNDSVKNNFSGGMIKSWFGCDDEASFYRILREGDAKFVTMVQETMPKNSGMATSIKRKTIKGDYGDELCPHAVNSGNLSTAWRRKKRNVGTKTRGIEIMVNIAGYCGVNAKDFAKMGATALAIAQYVSDAGYSVKITGMACSGRVTSVHDQINIFPIKDWLMPLDIQSLTSVCCFAGFFRGPGFVRLGQCTEGELSYGLGRPMNMKEIKLGIEKVFPLEGGHQRIFVPCVDEFHSGLKPADVIAKVLGELQRAPSEMLAAA